MQRAANMARARSSFHMTAVFTRFHDLCLGSLAALSLAACNGRLDVTDQNVGGSAGSGGNGGTGPGGSGGTGGSGGSGGGASGSAGTNGETALCHDGVQNGDETGVDCGGGLCFECNINGERPC